MCTFIQFVVQQIDTWAESCSLTGRNWAEADDIVRHPRAVSAVACEDVATLDSSGHTRSELLPPTVCSHIQSRFLRRLFPAAIPNNLRFEGLLALRQCDVTIFVC